MKSLTYFLAGAVSGLASIELIKRLRRKRVEFIDRKACDWFRKEFPCFIERHGNLESLHDKIFARHVPRNNTEDWVIFGLGSVCIDDYQQILLLCGNGFGIGALQLVRGMFERYVTSAYIATHPDQIDDFIDYTFVHKNKLFNQFRTTYRDSPEIVSRFVTDEDMAKIRADYEAVRDRFMKTKCKKCKTKEPMHSWHKLDPTQMALAAHTGLEGLAFYQYFRPTLLSHSTFISVDIRVRETPDGFVYDSKYAQRRYIAEALLGAHNLLLNVFTLQNAHFNLGLQAEIERCNEDYMDCWRSRQDARESKAEVQPAN